MAAGLLLHAGRHQMDSSSLPSPPTACPPLTACRPAPSPRALTLWGEDKRAAQGAKAWHALFPRVRGHQPHKQCSQGAACMQRTRPR